MRLKKLELLGFKSFADRTQVLFDQGVTCVVGPNGCGKSNISDSIRWVLGERSAKLLRGSKMEDVIFNGTDFRKPLAMAEVSLTIDNADRGLPIDYSEVTITRRLYRSGESEYLINKTLCRLKDIQDLILDTGIGSSSYSMIEQGRIDYILNADAEARRFLIEEAAGISKFKVKKEEAIRKLEKTEENRLRLNDIIHEVHKNIQYAERQAKKAARYREEFEKLKTLEIRKAFFDLTQLAAERKILQEQQALLQAEIQSSEAQVSQCRKQQEELSALLREILGRYSAAESQRYNLQNRIEQNQQQLRFQQEKKIEIANRKGQIEQEKSQLEQRVHQAAAEIELKERELSFLDEQKTQLQEAVKDAETALALVERELENVKSKLDQTKKDSFQRAAETARLRSEYHRLIAFLESSGIQIKKQEAGVSRLREEAAQWQAKKESCESEIRFFEERLAELNRRKGELEEEILGGEAILETEKNELQAHFRLRHEKETRLNLLAEIDRSARESEDALLEDGENFERSLAKSLREIFTVQPGYEWALEAALESFSRSLIADDQKTAEILLSRMREKKISSVGLFIKGISSAPDEIMDEKPQHEKIHQALSEVVDILDEYKTIFQPFLRRVYIAEAVPTLEMLQELMPFALKNKLITQEGIVLGPDARIFFRNIHISAEDNLFRRGAEISSLEREVESFSGLIKQKEASIAERLSHAGVRSSELEQIEAERLDATVQKESFDSMRKGMEDRLASFKREIELSAFESEEILSQQSEASAQKGLLEAQLAEAENFETALREEQDNLTRSLDSIDQKKASALHSYAENKAQFSNLADRLKMTREALVLMSDHLERDRSRSSALAEETLQIIDREFQLNEKDIQLAAENAELEEARREADIALELVRQEKEKTESEVSENQRNLQTLMAHQHELQSSLHQFDIKLMDLGFKEKNITERLDQAYRIQLNELDRAQYAAEPAPEEGFEPVISELRSKVESLGTVNMLAIEEYEELKQRYEFLMTQQKDLDEAREQLMETIRKINRTTKGLFEETFANVQKAFQEYYQTLFRGGMAKLVLMDESNPLESGIDIVVRPPGKKLQNLTLLSGGEKALTAIALLFALFTIKPSPFCVLDEVDAPLDEANVDRFITVLRTFLTKSQFIIVTHNRKTIAMGDSLYGVTMEEAGVSKLVSVKVNTDTQTSEVPAHADKTEEQKDKTEDTEQVHA